MEETFENWLDIFIDECRDLGYNGPIDGESFEPDYEAGKSPEEAAAEFVKEMSDW
jgi:hypothetical protein